MKSLQFAAFAAVLACSAAVAEAEEYFPPPFQGVVAPLRFINTSPYPVTITLWHPQAPNRPWGSYVVLGNGSYLVPDSSGNRPLFFGDDWGLQIGNSPIKPLSRCASLKQPWPPAPYFVSDLAIFWSR